MNKKAKIGLAAGVLALTAAGGATYHGWQEGWIPTSILAAHPRAPLPENFIHRTPCSKSADQPAHSPFSDQTALELQQFTAKRHTHDIPNESDS